MNRQLAICAIMLGASVPFLTSSAPVPQHTQWACMCTPTPLITESEPKIMSREAELRSFQR